MTTIDANIIADSVNPAGDRITTFVLTYPLALCHAHMQTHGTLRLSTASQRAIPTAKLAERVRTDPALPIFWGKAQKGMGSAVEVEPEIRAELEQTWRENACEVSRWAESDAADGLAKEYANRHMTAYEWTTVILSGTDFANFFRRRVHPKAQAETRRVAHLMLKARVASTPRRVEWDGWHIPFGDRMPDDVYGRTQLEVASARCARVSYENHAGQIDVQDDCRLHDLLLAERHMVPLEHPSKAVPGRHGAYTGWQSYRHQVERPEGPLDEAALLAEYEKQIGGAS